MAGGPLHVGVVGAGIVGAACALRLAMDGHRVTVLDPAPASGASHGNAGQVGTAGIVPFVNARTAAMAGRWMRDPDHPLSVTVPGMARNWRWVRRFRRAATDAREAAASEALLALTRSIYDDLLPLARAAGAADLIDRRGTLQVFEREETLRAMEPDYALRERHGIALTRLDRAGLLALEPALGPRARAGVLFDDAALVRDPGGLVRAFLRAAVERGAAHERHAARRLRGPVVETDAGERRFDRVVLAAGIAARGFFRALGVRVPLWAERGYHLQLPRADHGLTRSVLFYDRRVVYSPMRDGLRLTTGAEFAKPDAPPDHARHRRLMAAASGLLARDPDLSEGVAWVGSRPSPPDFLPIVGPAPKAPAVILAAGHGHSGLTFAGPTARIVSDVVAGGTAPAALAPDRPA